MAEPEQSFKKHAKIVPLFHYVVFPILAVNMSWAARNAIQSPGADTIIAFATALALVVLFFFIRIFPLKVQDRLIRLEMRLRLREVLPQDMHPNIPMLTPAQMVALRFASDAELPELVRTVLRDRIHDKKTIKSMIKSWVPDHVRM